MPVDTSSLIDSLVATYRELNVNFRNHEGTPEAREVLVRMRDDEIAFAQALKDHLTGIGTADSEEKEVVDGSERTFAQIISQFGSVRATTLNLLKGIEDPAGWDAADENGKTVREHVQDLVESDRNQLQRLGQLLGV